MKTGWSWKTLESCAPAQDGGHGGEGHTVICPSWLPLPSQCMTLNLAPSHYNVVVGWSEGSPKSDAKAAYDLGSLYPGSFPSPLLLLPPRQAEEQPIGLT